MRTSSERRLCSVTSSKLRRRRSVGHRAARRCGMPQRLGQQPPGHRARIGAQFVRRTRGDQFTAAHAGAWTEVDDVIGVANRVFVVLDDQQRVARSGQRIERVEQHGVVARMQSDRRFIEDVAHALQVRAELRREPDTLRLATRQAWARRGRARDNPSPRAAGIPGGCESPRAHRARSRGRARRGAAACRTCGKHIDAERGQLADRAAAEPQVQRDGIEPRAVAGGTGPRRRAGRCRATAFPRRFLPH